MRIATMNFDLSRAYKLLITVFATDCKFPLFVRRYVFVLTVLAQKLCVVISTVFENEASLAQVTEKLLFVMIWMIRVDVVMNPELVCVCEIAVFTFLLTFVHRFDMAGEIAFGRSRIGT